MAQFDSTGNTVDGNGDLAGVANLYIDGVLVGSEASTKTDFGDSLNRPIGINRWAGGAADWNQGAIYNPSVYLGTTAVPEPSAPLLLGLGSILLAFRRNK